MEEASRLAYRSASVGRIQSAYGSSAANSAGSMCVLLTGRPGGGRGVPLRVRRPGRSGLSGAVALGLFLAVRTDVVAGDLVQVTQEQLLVAQREVGDRTGGQHRLGGLQGVGVLERVLLERDGRQL